MLLDLKTLQEKYEINLKTVLHVGAHKAEELGLYEELGAKSVIWIESNSKLANELKQRLEFPFNTIIEATIADFDGRKVTFSTANNSQSSSILALGEHSQLFPDVHYCKSEEKVASTLKTILQNLNRSFDEVGFLNLDIQGAELLAIKGCGESISKIPFIYTEINSRPVYEDCAIVEEIDQYLSNFGFSRTETAFWNDHPWGDALYVRK